ncbi:uncharacterized protein [Nicotiana tomentosiformis]|uniref:uncharacterized protein n=1 Tax=Nicotiana tomentosiformis TaxID=4098 RepID=UPI00388CE9A8
MLQLNDRWDSVGGYKDFDVDEIVVNEDSNYSQLNSAIAEHLMTDTSAKIIEIKYTVKECCPPMEIRNDVGVRSSNYNTIGEVSGTVKLIDMQTSSAIVEYESIIITEHTPNVIEVGQVYQDKQIIVSAMKHYSDMNKFQFRVKRSSARSLHTCSLMDNAYIQRKSTTIVVGSMVMPKYADPKTIYTIKDIQTDILSDHGMNLTYMQAWKGKEKALEFLRGHPADSYSRLPSYLYILEKTYPGSVVKLQKTEDDCFLYTFVALSTSIKGWEHCRPVVVVDCTFLKSAYREIMLTGSTMDAACSILPLAYVVVDAENDASWRSKFKKGHLKLSELYFATARSYTLDEFNERISKIEEIDTRVKAYLYDIGYHRWSRVHATVNRTWTMTSNIAESLNAVRVSTDYIHTVIDGVKRFIIFLQNKRCSYGQFQLDELPCPHALAALIHRNESYENYCSPYYTRENLLHTYEIPVDPLPDESKWNVSQHITEEVVMPHTGKRQSGRPQK